MTASFDWFTAPAKFPDADAARSLRASEFADQACRSAGRVGSAGDPARGLTGAPTAEAVPFIEAPRPREMHFGDWGGRSAADVMASTPEALRQFWENPFGSAPPRAEPLESVRARVSTLWRELLACEADEGVLVVTHGGPIRILLAEFSGAPRTHLLDIEVPHAALFDTSALTAAAAQ